VKTYYVYTRAGGFRSWVRVARIEAEDALASAREAVERLKAQDDPMWGEAEYLISTSRRPSPEEVSL
jgi:hypothetical protein